jgi:hypothetical protein
VGWAFYNREEEELSNVHEGTWYDNGGTDFSIVEPVYLLFIVSIIMAKMIFAPYHISLTSSSNGSALFPMHRHCPHVGIDSLFKIHVQPIRGH